MSNHVSRYIFALSMGLLSAVTPALAESNSRPAALQMAQADSLTGSWRLVNMGEIGSPGVVLQANELTAEFAESRISGSGGCNRFMGGYEIPQAGTLSIGPLASTFMACEQPIANQEAQYLKALQAAQRYELDDEGQLAIFYRTDQESGVLRFAGQNAGQNVRGLW